MSDREFEGESEGTAGSIPERSRRQVAAAEDRLREEYGAFDVLEETWTVDGEEYEEFRERFEAGTVGGAGAWIRDDDGRVLLVRNVGDEGWSDPGGKHEPGETLEETARREVAEEANVDCTVVGVAQTHEITIDAPGRPPLHRFIAVFDARYESGDPEPADGEIDAVRWWRTHPETLRYDALERLSIPAESDDEQR